MKSRMQKLWDKTVPAGGPSPRPDPDAVLRRVNAALDGKPRIRLRRPLKCVLALSAVLLLLLAGTAIAAESIFLGRGVLGAFFGGDGDEYALSIINIKQNSVSDENYTMTVTSSLADKHEAYFTLVIEPKTERAKYFLSGNGEEYFSAPLMFRSTWFGGFSGGINGTSSPDDPDILCLEVRWDGNLGPWKTVYVRMDDMEKGLWLKIPLEPCI